MRWPRRVAAAVGAVTAVMAVCVVVAARHGSVAHAQTLSGLQQAKQAIERSAIQRAVAAPRYSGPVPQAIPRPDDPTSPTPITIQADFPLTKGAPADASSVWFLDDVPNAGHTLWGSVYLVVWKPSGSRNATLERSGLDMLAGLGAEYNAVWQSPRAVGAIAVKTVSGLNGIVSFTTSTGTSGTFNMQTDSWTFTK